MLVQFCVFFPSISFVSRLIDKLPWLGICFFVVAVRVCLWFGIFVFDLVWFSCRVAANTPVNIQVCSWICREYHNRCKCCDSYPYTHSIHGAHSVQCPWQIIFTLLIIRFYLSAKLISTHIKPFFSSNKITEWITCRHTCITLYVYSFCPRIFSVHICFFLHR